MNIFEITVETRLVFVQISSGMKKGILASPSKKTIGSGT